VLLQLSSLDRHVSTLCEVWLLIIVLCTCYLMAHLRQLHATRLSGPVKPSICVPLDSIFSKYVRLSFLANGSILVFNLTVLGKSQISSNSKMGRRAHKKTLVASKEFKLRACLVAHATQKSLHSTCHIESYGTCMEY
jgi:hypothetical protein